MSYPSVMDSVLIAALPMYDFPELRAAHDTFWRALADRLAAAGMTEVPRQLARDLGHFDVWKSPALVFGQGCEYPLAKSFAASVRSVATPCYSAPGCDGATYRSAIVVRARDAGVTLAEFRGRRCAINEPDSNSGTNLLRAAVAPLSGGARFFESVVVSGSHRGSARMVAGGDADLAALDCVTFAHLQRLYPGEVAGLRILCWTPASPSLPFITARRSSDATVEVLRSVLSDLFAGSDALEARRLLLMDGIDLQPDASFSQVLALERRAAELGYPHLR